MYTLKYKKIPLFLIKEDIFTIHFFFFGSGYPYNPWTHLMPVAVHLQQPASFPYFNCVENKKEEDTQVHSAPNCQRKIRIYDGVIFKIYR